MSLFEAAPCASCWLAVAAVAAAWLLWVHTYWMRRGVTQTWPVPLLGDLWSSLLGKRTRGYVLMDMQRRYDGVPFVGLYQFVKPRLLVRDPDLVKEVLVQNFASFQNNETIFPEGKDDFFSDNPFAAEFERWKPLRTRLSSTLSPARVRVAFEDQQASAMRLADYLEGLHRAQGGATRSVEGFELARRYTAHTSARVLFGIESHSLEVGSPPGPFFDQGFAIFNGGLMNMLRFIAFFHWPAALHLLGFSLASQETLSFFRKLIRDSVEYRHREGVVRDDFVQHAAKQLLVDGKVDESRLREMTGQAVNTYVETFETSGLVLGTALLLLAVHPDSQDHLRDDLRAALPSDGRAWQAEELNAVPYLEWVIKETLRLYPVADVVRRACTRATTLRSGSHGVALRPGDVVHVGVDGLHRDAALWERPDDFHPEHFEPERSESRHKMAFLGFSDGPRACPGMRYAMQQVKVALAAVVLRLRVEPGPEQVVPLERDAASPLLGFRGGVWLRFRPLLEDD